jgi:phospholipid/cholesterol/gamma-HCH transport system substrate-binding protein
MDTTNTSNQLRAGFFMILGFLCIGSLVIYFGRFGEGVKKYYTLTVEYRNASGIVKGADVMLAGAKIGEVATPPTVLPNMRGVAVPLKIEETVQIPQGSVFSIGSSGLLGDRFVTVTMDDHNPNPQPIAPGTVVKNGQSESSISELQRQLHDEILPKLSSALDNIDAVSKSLHDDVFNKQGVQNLQITLANFRTTSDAMAASSGELKGVMAKANVFLKKGNNAMDSVQGATGDLKAFVINLRQHGIIFYKDSAGSSAGPLKKLP